MENRPYIPLEPIKTAFELVLKDTFHDSRYNEGYLYSATVDEAYDFMENFNKEQICVTPYRLIGIPKEIQITNIKVYEDIQIHRNVWIEDINETFGRPTIKIAVTNLQTAYNL